MEIERKWLVAGWPEGAVPSHTYRMDQGYIALSPTVRIRREAEGEAVRLLSLAELRDTEVDMFTTVFIGNRETVPIRGRMVTPRGYRYEGETNGRD